MRCGQPFGPAVVLFFALAPDYRKHPVSGENQPSMRRGPPRVLTGPHGFPRAFLPDGFPPLKLPFASRFVTRFCAGEVLRRLVASTYFSWEKRITERKGRDVGETRSNAFRTAVRDCRGPVFGADPRLQKTSCKWEKPA